MTYLVTGARGLIGRSVVDHLLTAGKTVRAASSQPEQAVLPAEVELIGLDSTDSASAMAAFDGVERAFLYADHVGMDNLVAAARRSGVKHIVLLSSVAAERPGNIISDMHLAAEVPLQESGLPVTILRPGAFAGNARWWISSIKSDRSVPLPFPGVHQDPIHEDDLAEAVVTALTEPGHAGKIYPLTGPESLSFQRMVEILGDALGEPLRIDHISYEDALKFMLKPALDIWAQVGDAPIPIGPTVESVTGRPARTFAQWAVDHVAEFESTPPVRV